MQIFVYYFWQKCLKNGIIEIVDGFGEWNARIEKYLNRLLSKSTDYFANQFNNGELEDTNSEYVTMLESIFNIEEFL